MSHIQNQSPIWHSHEGIDRLIALVNANDKKRRAARAAESRAKFAHITPQGREVITNINRIEAAMLAGFDPISAQKELDAMSMTNDPHLLGDNIPVLRPCRKGFGANDCDMPLCDCGAMPLREMTEEEHMDQIDSDREPRRPASFKHLAVMCLATAMFTVLAIVSSPALLARAAEILKSWL